MPAISMFFGIVIYMYYDEHLPPHFHAKYQGYEALFDFEGEIIDGSLQPRQKKLVSAWALIHQEDLEADWELARTGRKPFRIEPLK